MASKNKSKQGKTNFKGELGMTVIKKNDTTPQWKRKLKSIKENFSNLFSSNKIKTTYQEGKENE